MRWTWASARRILLGALVQVAIPMPLGLALGLQVGAGGFIALMIAFAFAGGLIAARPHATGMRHGFRAGLLTLPVAVLLGYLSGYVYAVTYGDGLAVLLGRDSMANSLLCLPVTLIGGAIGGRAARIQATQLGTRFAATA